MLSIESYHQDRVKDLCSSRGPLPFSVHKLTFGGRNQHRPNVLHYQFEKRNCSESGQGRLETVLAHCPDFLWLEPNSPPYNIIWQGASELFCFSFCLFFFFSIPTWHLILFVRQIKMLLGNYDELIFLFIDLIVILMLITHVHLCTSHLRSHHFGPEAHTTCNQNSAGMEWGSHLNAARLFRQYRLGTLCRRDWSEGICCLCFGIYIFLHWKCHKKKEIKLFPNQKPV